MTTPAQDAPLVFPSVAFRPLRLLAICCALAALAVGLAAMAGHIMVGVFFGVGLALGLSLPASGAAAVVVAGAAVGLVSSWFAVRGGYQSKTM